MGESMKGYRGACMSPCPPRVVRKAKKIFSVKEEDFSCPHEMAGITRTLKNVCRNSYKLNYRTCRTTT